MGKYIPGPVGDPNTNTHFRGQRNPTFKSGIVGTQQSFNNNYRLPPTDRSGRPIFIKTR